jgi:hypothetical protein
LERVADIRAVSGPALIRIVITAADLNQNAA